MAERGDSYGGLTRQERSDARRARLEDAAVALFAERDYDAVTVADICARAQVAKRHFYEHFSDRSALATSVRLAKNRWLLDAIMAAAPTDATGPRELILPIHTALVRQLAQHPDVARVIYLESPRMEHGRRDLLHHEAEMFGVLVRQVVDGDPDPVRFQRTMLALVAGISQVLIEWIEGEMREPGEMLVEHLTAIACAHVASLTD